MRAGSVIEFKDKKGILLAMCKRLEGPSVRLLTEGGKEFSYPADKVAHVTSHVLDPAMSDPHLREQLVDIRGRVQEMAREVRLEDLWEFYTGTETEGISLEEMARTYFGDDLGSDHKSAMLRALHEDPLYFKKKGELYLPKPPEAVSETRRQLADNERRQREREAAVAWIRAARVGQRRSEPEGLDRHIRMLKGLALFREELDGYVEASGFLRELGEEVPDGAFGLLVEIGVFKPDENTLLIKEHVPTEFSEPLTEAARLAGERAPSLVAGEGSRAAPPPESLGPPLADRELPRLDLRALDALSIDDLETREIDDALTLERLAGGGFRVGVHIADLSAHVPRDSPLDQEALRRATTIYLPERTIPMLPEPISHQAASLVAETERLALTLLADLDDAAQVRAFTFAPSILRVRRAVTYEDASALCEDPQSPMAILAELSKRLREERVRRGARVFERAELKIRVSPEGEISIKKRQGEGPADIVVSELMILANQLAGTFCSERQVPAVYRVQPPPAEEIAGGGAVSRRFLTMVKKIQVQTSPGVHWGLGLSAYAQMTSPIRRYLDLVVHRQLKKALGDPREGYTDDELRERIAATEPAVEIAHNAQRWSNKYWVLKYLASHVGEATPAVVQEVRDESYLVQLSEYLFDIPFYPPPGRKYQPGDPLVVKIKAVDPRKGILKVSEARG